MINATTTNTLEITFHTCPACGELKGSDAFGMRGAYRQSYCNPCRSAKSRKNSVVDIMKTIRFGVEIEWTHGSSQSMVRNAIERFNTPGKVWTVVHDGSCPRGGEVVSPILSWEDMATVQEVARAIRSTGAVAGDGSGIHVHVDGGRFGNLNQVRNLVRMHHRFSGAIGAVCNTTEGRTRMCKTIPASVVAKIEAVDVSANDASAKKNLADAWYNDGNSAWSASDRAAKYNHSRYHNVNLHSFFYRGTVEFRHFNGTLHAGKIRSYIELCLAIAAKSIDAAQVSSKLNTSTDETALYRYLGLTGAEFKVMRHHLTNNARAHRGELELTWNESQEAA